MKFYDTITKNTINDKANRIAGTTDEVYLIRDKLADVNAALDEYCFLAMESAPQGTFDDTNNTQAPVETQDLADGTNAYKLTDFSSNVLGINKVSILTADAVEIDLIFVDFDDVHDFLESFSTTAGDRSQPTHWMKFGDYIYITPTPDYAETAGLRCYMNRELSKLAYVTYTTTNASNQIDAVAHGLSDGDTIIMSTAGVISSGLTADTQVYYVRDKATDSFKVALTHTGAAVALADDGTGLQQFVHLSKTPGIPVIHHDFLTRFAADKFMDEDHPKFRKNRADLGQDRLDIQDYWQSRNKQAKTIIETKRRLTK